MKNKNNIRYVVALKHLNNGRVTIFKTMHDLTVIKTNKLKK